MAGEADEEDAMPHDRNAPARRGRLRRAARPRRDAVAGRVLVLAPHAMAHQGAAVARTEEGRVVFVRGALPGERVRVELTEGDEGSKFWRGRVLDVLEASSERVSHRWAEADSTVDHEGVGGADYGFVELGAQRRIKAGIVADLMARIGHLDRAALSDLTVEGLPGDDEADGLAWRTRVRFAVDDEGRPGMFEPRSHTIRPLHEMPLAVPGIRGLDVLGRAWPGAEWVEVVAPAGSRTALVLVRPRPGRGVRLPRFTEPSPGGVSVPEDLDLSVAVAEGAGWRVVRGRSWVRETVEAAGRRHDYRVTADGFWQIHRAAPATLVTAVLDAARPQPGDWVLDLYSGAGLFTAFLAEAVGASGRVLAVETGPGSVRDARRNLRGVPQVELAEGRVDDVLGRRISAGEMWLPGRGVVVMDPPRSGAGRTVVDQVVRLAPRAVVYVACDPAALARDVAYFAERGWGLSGLRAFDLFPNTSHVECVATFAPDPATRVAPRE